ncbi:MAG: aspartate--tRNA(Asn) ligase, partial [Chloroflexota bacterium]|nr:aspartate--tRNA(Asn) ligase [Chloroflexota bacterium]
MDQTARATQVERTERVRTTEAAVHLGRQVRLQGWLHQFRELGKVNFLIVRDGWGLFQAVVEDPATLETLRAAGVESVIEVRGRVEAEPQAPGGVELRGTRVRILAPVEEPPPVEVNKREMRASLDTFLEHAVVGLRHPKRRAILRLLSATIARFRAAVEALGCTEIHTPKIIGTATEGGANVFTVDYFGRPAFLAQSPQLYKQIAVGFFERVYEIGPAFRAEPHATGRHLAEYTSLDAEFGFIEDHTTVMAYLTEVVRGMMAAARERCVAELALLGADVPEVPAVIPSIYYPEAQDLLLARYSVDCRGEPDLSPEHERFLGRWAAEEHGSDFVYVTGYPTAKRAFYTHPNPADPRYSNSF